MALHVTNTQEADLHHTITHIETRLAAIGETGDCAYEKALARSYSELLMQYRKQLFILKARRYLQSQPTTLVTQREAE